MLDGEKNARKNNLVINLNQFYTFFHRNMCQ